MTALASAVLLSLMMQSIPAAPRPPALPPGGLAPADGSAAPDGYAPSPQWLGQTRAPAPAAKSQ